MASLTAAHTPNLKSSAALVVDLADGQTIYGKNTQSKTPIASITKLMTSMVVLDANLPPDETIYIDAADYDSIKGTTSRLGKGTGLARQRHAAPCADVVGKSRGGGPQPRISRRQ